MIAQALVVYAGRVCGLARFKKEQCAYQSSAADTPNLLLRRKDNCKSLIAARNSTRENLAAVQTAVLRLIRSPALVRDLRL